VFYTSQEADGISFLVYDGSATFDVEKYDLSFD
jgi:hypothetical protein